MTNDRQWRLADLTFVPSGEGRERATINGVEVVRENGRYWIVTPNGPLWSDIDERGVDPALNYLFGKRKQEQSSHTNKGPQDRSRISLLEPHEVQYWADKFGVSKERLSEAVRNVGHSAVDVERELKKLA
jgi:hypothetical protein